MDQPNSFRESCSVALWQSSKSILLTGGFDEFSAVLACTKNKFPFGLSTIHPWDAFVGVIHPSALLETKSVWEGDRMFVVCWGVNASGWALSFFDEKVGVAESRVQQPQTPPKTCPHSTSSKDHWRPIYLNLPQNIPACPARRITGSPTKRCAARAAFPKKAAGRISLAAKPQMMLAISWPPGGHWQSAPSSKKQQFHPSGYSVYQNTGVPKELDRSIKCLAYKIQRSVLELTVSLTIVDSCSSPRWFPCNWDFQGF